MLELLAGSAGLAAALAAGYQSMVPTGQWYGKTFIGLPRRSNKLALTYDDGPNDPHTLRLLEVLARHRVHATFFLIGRFVKQRPDLARAIVDAGHVIGNHTFSHPNLIFASVRKTRAEIQDCRSAIQDAVSEHSNLFRPPFGGRRPGTLQIVRAMNLVPVMWNVTGWDWKAPRAEHIERKVSAQVKGGDVILLHDGGHYRIGADRSQTVIATDRLITRYHDAGYEFVTISQMIIQSEAIDRT